MSNLNRNTNNLTPLFKCCVEGQNTHTASNQFESMCFRRAFFCQMILSYHNLILFLKNGSKHVLTKTSLVLEEFD